LKKIELGKDLKEFLDTIKIPATLKDKKDFKGECKSSTNCSSDPKSKVKCWCIQNGLKCIGYNRIGQGNYCICGCTCNVKCKNKDNLKDESKF